MTKEKRMERIFEIDDSISLTAETIKEREKEELKQKWDNLYKGKKEYITINHKTETV